MRAIPEKTLEHWISREVARRFPSASLWWPSSGEDVSVDDIGGRPGKWFMLEVKTTEWEKRSGRNRLSIDLEQLDKYLRSGLPVFYVFPVPPWDDVLGSILPWLGGWRRGDLGNPMVGHRWFAHWSYVLSARDVDRLVGKTFPPYKRATLFTSSSRTRIAQIPAGARTLNQFLSVQGQCGDIRGQAGILLPRETGLTGRVLRADLAAKLRELPATGVRSERQLTYFLPLAGDDNGDMYREVGTEVLVKSLAAVKKAERVPGISGCWARWGTMR